MYIYIYVYFFSKNYYRLLFRDHSGGNEEIVRSVDGLTVYGGDSRIPALTKKVVHDDTFKVIIVVTLMKLLMLKLLDIARVCTC